MNQTIEALKDWRSYRRFYARKGGTMSGYYQKRLEEYLIDSLIVGGCMFAVLIIIVVSALKG